MQIGRLAALQYELRLLDRRTFLSTRERRRRETLVRQIATEEKRLELLTRKRQQRLDRRQKVAEYREERRLNKRGVRQEVGGPLSDKPVKLKTQRCMMCGRRMRGRKRRFCGKKCRRATHKLPSPQRIKDECEKIIGRWDAAEEVRRSRSVGGAAKFRLAAQLIDRYGRRQPVNQSAAEMHDFIFHGSGENRSDSDYWNQIPEQA